ncbi:MAG: hypothetical protein NTX49_07255 [Chlamydiae bacterium]|nr:hypothetical protein [Chlamydiota bacterium]
MTAITGTGRSSPLESPMVISPRISPSILARVRSYTALSSPSSLPSSPRTPPSSPTISPTILARQSSFKTLVALSDSHHGSSSTERNRAAEIINRFANERIFPFMVLGNEEIRVDPELLRNLGILSVDPCPSALAILQKNFSSTTPDVDRLYTHGSIVIDENWSIPFNDALIIRGIHDGIDFQIGLKGAIPTEKNLWTTDQIDPSKSRPRVFARELAMLQLAGYQYHVVRNASGEILETSFKKPEGKDCSKITLQECVDMLKGFKTKADAERLIKMFADPIVHEYKPVAKPTPVSGGDGS